MVLKIGLTGGIGSGKTTVAKLFTALGVPVIDADEIAHELVKPGNMALAEIAKTFGHHYLLSNGQLDRIKMRELVFTDKQAKQQLEAIMHPLVLTEIYNILQDVSSPYCIICIPLLFESNMVMIVDRILVVDCPEQQQVERVRKRAQMNVEQIQAIINSQVARDTRLSKADDIIDNTGAETNLSNQVKGLHTLYISLSTSF